MLSTHTAQCVLKLISHNCLGIKECVGLNCQHKNVVTMQTQGIATLANGYESTTPTSSLITMACRLYGAPFVSKFFLKDYGSGTNQMGGFVGGAPFLQMADS